jgi:hypothetical protein
VRRLQARIDEAYYVEKSTGSDGLPQAYVTQWDTACAYLGTHEEGEGFAITLLGVNDFKIRVHLPSGEVMEIIERQASFLGYYLEKAWRIAKAGPVKLPEPYA